MRIADNRTIQAIQEEFSKVYPGLKIEFYQDKHKAFEGSTLEDQYDSSLPLYEIRAKHAEGDIILKPEMTISEIETLFEELFGLHIQIFRKSRNMWLQTTVTDNWSLEKQNQKGLHSMLAKK